MLSEDISVNHYAVRRIHLFIDTLNMSHSFLVNDHPMLFFKANNIIIVSVIYFFFLHALSEILWWADDCL